MVIDSEYKGSGELLPYYYYYYNRWFDKAIYIHDSVFINKPICTDNIDTVKFLWHFNGGEYIDSAPRTKELLGYLDHNNELIHLFNRKSDWVGCFGGMSVIQHDYLRQISDKYNMFILLKYINTRQTRMSFERIFGIICCAENAGLVEDPSIFEYYSKNANSRNDMSYSYNSYIEDERNDAITSNISKLFFGR